MTWIKLDDNFSDHPKIAGLSDRAFRVHVGALCYSARHLTDGRIPKRLAREWGKAAELVAAGVWHDEGEVFLIHDFSDWQPPASQERERRQRIKQERSKAGSKGAANRWQKEWQNDGPVPVPEPVVPKTSGPDGPTDIQHYLLLRLHDHDETWRELTYGAVVKANKQFSRSIVTLALQRLWQDKPAPRRPYPYFISVCNDVAEGAVA